MNLNTLKAIFRRDFVSYFSNPTGYVFICVFVVLSALATFWPPEFFANNLANLDQLSRWLPFIMLVFIPAITMSMWAEERRQGTDELLLTIPASDSDVVLGKYLAGVAIFTVSLLFSALAIFLVFNYGLGSPDPGLFFSTYVGYWFIGIAMIAVGMVASFLTPNLTVGFILGALFNMPLALFGVAHWFIKDPAWAQRVQKWSALEQFRGFERGVISIGGIAYFVLLAAVMLYLCMVLIGRRHWQAREDDRSLIWHYLVRAIALLAVAFGVTAVLQEKNWLRADVSSAQLSSLSADTIKLIGKLRDDKDVPPIKIDAYVSPRVPTEYAPTKLNLLSTLEELKALGGGKIQVVKHEIENYGEEAELAEKNYGITPQEQMVGEGAQTATEEFFLGVAFRAGPDKVVVPFINKGIPVEYELVRSILTVAQSERKKIGVVDTGVPIMDRSSSARNSWALVNELRKQYDVTLVDPAQPIKDNFAALLVVQPSMLGPQQMDHLVDAIKAGMPAALFEDPYPFIIPPQMAAGTDEPKMNPMAMQMGMFGGAGNEPKGDLQQLWRLLGVRMNGSQVVWQQYSPEQSVRTIEDDQWVFIDSGNGAEEPFNGKNAISSGLNQVLLLYPGSFTKSEDSKLDFESLMVTGSKNSGTVMTQSLTRGELGRVNRENFSKVRTSDGYIVAAQVSGLAPLDALLPKKSTDDEADPADDPELAAKRKEAEKNRAKMNVVLVADIDCLIDGFFMIRERGDSQFLEAAQNVTFLLNVVDQLTGDTRFINIRKRARAHRTLTKIDEATLEYRRNAAKQEEEFVGSIQEKIDAAQTAYNEKMDAVDKRTDLTALQREILRRQIEIDEQRKLQREVTNLEQTRRREVKKIEYGLEQNVRSVQDLYKMIAIVLPPIPPLLLAVWVFFRRREAERQGVARERLR